MHPPSNTVAGEFPTATKRSVRDPYTGTASGDGSPVRRRYRFVALLKVAVSAGLLALLLALSRDELSMLSVDSKSAAAAWLAAAALTIAAAFVTATIRWAHVAETLGVGWQLRSLLSAYLAAQFVGNFLPTTIGGDILRVNRLGRATSDSARAFASVIIERLTGWIVLPLMTLVALIADLRLLEQPAGQVAAAMAVGTLALLCGIVWAAEHPKGLGRLTGGADQHNRLTASTGNAGEGSPTVRRRVREGLSAVHIGLSTYRGAPRTAARLIAVGLAYQCLLVAATAMVGTAIGVTLPLTAWCAFVPMVLVAQVAPFAIGGLGVREAALVLFLSPFAVADGQAILLGLLLYAVTLLVSLAGAPALALGGRRCAFESRLA